LFTEGTSQRDDIGHQTSPCFCEAASHSDGASLRRYLNFDTWWLSRSLHLQGDFGWRPESGATPHTRYPEAISLFHFRQISNAKAPLYSEDRRHQTSSTLIFMLKRPSRLVDCWVTSRYGFASASLNLAKKNPVPWASSLLSMRAQGEKMRTPTNKPGWQLSLCSDG